MSSAFLFLFPSFSILPYDLHISHCFYYLLFFFKLYDDHRDLHSFPTRRSSDLKSCPMLGKKCVNGLISAPMPRSEEHTSELQSRGHLVCRLLLEKKNTYHYDVDVG